MKITVDMKRVDFFAESVIETLSNNKATNDDYLNGYERGIRTILQYILEISEEDD